MAPPSPSFQFLEVTRGTSSCPHVAILSLSRPSHFNALSPPMLFELKASMSSLDEAPDVRAIILIGSGRHFCSGVDFAALASIASSGNPKNSVRTSKGTECTECGSNDCICVNCACGGCKQRKSVEGGGVEEGSDGACEGRKREKLRREILAFQECISAFENCRKPVIAAVHGVCIGAGIDLISACDIRYCEANAKFSVKEVDLALAADFGTLQRLPKIIGEGNARELALTGRDFGGEEALRLGFVSKVYKGVEQMMKGVTEMAESIAWKSPLAVMGTKRVLVHARDHSIKDGLDYVATWNSAMLISKDMEEVMRARRERRSPRFSKL